MAERYSQTSLPNGVDIPRTFEELNTSLTDVMYNVKSLGVKGDYNKTLNKGTDDTLIFKSILSTYRGSTIYVPKGVYLISSALIVYNDTNLVLHPQAEIFFKSGMGAGNPNSWYGIHMLKNDLTNGIKNIRISGGLWNGNGQNQTHDSMRGMRLEGITNLVVEDLKMIEVNGWGIPVINCKNYLIQNIEFDQIENFAYNGDGVHIVGGSDGLIQNIHGFTNDDMIAIGAGDTLFTNKQNATNIIIRNVRTLKKGSYDTYKAIAMYSGGGYKIDNVIVDGVIGNTYAPMVIIANGKATEGIGYYGKISINNVIGNSVTERQPFNIDKYNDTGGDTSKKVFIDNLTITNYQRKKDSTHVDNQPIISCRYADIKNFSIVNFKDEYDGAGGQLMYGNNTDIDNLTLIGYDRSQVTTGLDSNSIFFLNTCNIGSLDINNIHDYVLSNGSPIVEVDASCLIDSFKASNVNRKIIVGNLTPACSLLFIHATSEATNVEMSNISVVFEDNGASSLVYQYGKVKQAFLVNCKGYSKTLPNPISLYTKNSVDTTIVTHIKYSNVYSGTYFDGYGNLLITAGKVRASGLDIRVDTATITDPKKGDHVLGKNGLLYLYDGTSWVQK